MDPVSHVLFGKILNYLDGRGRVGPGDGAAFILGSVLPDLDSALVPFGMDVYLLHHQAGTHSLLASPLEAGLLTLGIRFAVKAARPFPLFLAAWVAVLGHLFWDLADGSDMQLLAPFSAIRVGLHLVAMGEPFVVAPLVLAVLAVRLRLSSRRRAATFVLVFLTLVLGVKEFSQEAAERAFSRHLALLDDSGIAARREEVFGSLVLWRFFDRSEHRVRAWRVNAMTLDVRLIFERSLPEEDETVRASRRLPVVQNLLRVAELPFVWREREGEKDLVLWSDLQFCGVERCGLAFGGAFDKNALPLAQFVQIGPFRREKPLPSP